MLVLAGEYVKPMAGIGSAFMCINDIDTLLINLFSWMLLFSDGSRIHFDAGVIPLHIVWLRVMLNVSNVVG